MLPTQLRETPVNVFNLGKSPATQLEHEHDHHNDRYDEYSEQDTKSA